MLNSFFWLIHYVRHYVYNKYRPLVSHSKLPIHADPCLSQFPQQPITTVLECGGTIATARPWMLLPGSIQQNRKETEVKYLKSISLAAELLMNLQYEHKPGRV